MKKTTFYHAGCPVCVSAEHDILQLIGFDNVDIIDLRENKSELEKAEKLGVVSVPALVTPSQNVLHINFGASIQDLR